jgi:hypothetical protein
MSIKLWLLLPVVLIALFIVVRNRRRSLIGRFNSGKATRVEQQQVEMYIEKGLLMKNGYLTTRDGTRLPQVRISDDWLASVIR